MRYVARSIQVLPNSPGTNALTVEKSNTSASAIKYSPQNLLSTNIKNLTLIKNNTPVVYVKKNFLGQKILKFTNGLIPKKKYIIVTSATENLSRKQI